MLVQLIFTLDQAIGYYFYFSPNINVEDGSNGEKIESEIFFISTIYMQITLKSMKNRIRL
jgi:hypothetical protein